MLLPRFELYGVQPSGGALAAATACVCDARPTGKVRKAVYAHRAWHGALKDPRSGENSYSFLTAAVITSLLPNKNL